MAIHINTPRDNHLFYNGNYITVARGHNRTISFFSDKPGVVSQPANLNINGITDINLASYTATATLTSGTDSQIFFYEVISPKVVYKRLPENQGILLIDVTSVNTYPHPDVNVVNTHWLQNNPLKSSNIIIEKEISPGVWQKLTSFGVTGTSLINIDEPTVLRSKLIYAPGGFVEFEAIGDTFVLMPGGYLNDSFKYQIDTVNPGAYIYNNYITTFPQQTFILRILNDGIGYTHEYIDSNITPVIGTYSSLDKSLTITDLSVGIYNVTFNYNFYPKRFLNGLLITDATSYSRTSNFTIESVNVELGSYIQKPCSNVVEFFDSTDVFNPGLIGRGRVIYQIEIDSKWVDITSVPRNQSFTYNNCALEEGVYRIRKKFVARQIPNCGGVSKIILESPWVESTIEIKSFIPELEFDDPDCCYNLNEEFTLYPKLISLNNDLCQQSTLTGGFNPNNFDPNHFITFSLPNQSITYELFRFDIDTASWLPVLEYETLVVSNNPSSVSFRFTPDKLGPYKAKIKLKNCCRVVEREIQFDICDCLQVKPICKDTSKCFDCESYEIINNCSSAQTVSIKLAKTNQIIQSYTVNPLSKITHKFKEDNIYILTYQDKNVILPIFCKINECYNKLLKEQLCRTNSQGCCDDRELMNSRLATIQPMYQLFLNKTEYYNIRTSYRYTSIDINNQLDDFAEWDKIKEAILKYCDICRLNCPKCFNWSNGTCI